MNPFFDCTYSVIAIVVQLRELFQADQSTPGNHTRSQNLFVANIVSLNIFPSNTSKPPHSRIFPFEDLPSGFLDLDVELGEAPQGQGAARLPFWQ